MEGAAAEAQRVGKTLTGDREREGIDPFRPSLPILPPAPRCLAKWPGVRGEVASADTGQPKGRLLWTLSDNFANLTAKWAKLPWRTFLSVHRQPQHSSIGDLVSRSGDDVTLADRLMRTQESH